MWKTNLNILAAVCVLIMTLAGQSVAVTHYVSPGESIQAAINAASNGDEIEVSPGTYYEAINLGGKAVRLYSSGGPEVTTIDASGIAGVYHVVQCVSGEDANTVLEGFTITGGNANGPDPNDKGGGGMLNLLSSPTVTGCTFSGNSAPRGGGMYNNASSPTVTDCDFSDNSADLGGGGIYNYHNSPTVTNCTFTRNSSNYGGGIFNIATNSFTVINCTFIDNTAYNWGGGMYSNGGSPTVTGCTFSGNSAPRGGGMYNGNSSPTVTGCNFITNIAADSGGGIYSKNDSNSILTNCTFAGNSALKGGGMSNESSSPTVTNCTFAGNSALVGGGMYNESSSPTVTNCTFNGNSSDLGGGMYNYQSSPTVTNCILWADEPNEIVNDHNSNPTVTYSDVGGSWGGLGNIDADPCFVDAAVGNLRLKLESLCIDAADNNSVPADTADLDNDGNTVEPIPFDLGGLPRFIDGDNNDTVIVDMGAYEYIETLRLVAHWKLDEYYGDTAYDSAGENHGTLYGGPPHWHPAGGQVGGALQLDGVDDYVDCGNNNSLNIVNEITLAGWVKTNDAGNSENNPYVVKGDYSYALKHFVTNSIEFFIFDDGWRVVRHPIDSSFNGVWHHIAGIYDGSRLKLYIDGGLEATNAYAGSINISAYNVNIGRNPQISSRLYNGMIDDVRIYNYALTDDEILYLTCTEPIQSDLDGNCKVDFRDFALLLSEWLTCNLPQQELCW